MKLEGGTDEDVEKLKRHLVEVEVERDVEASKDEEGEGNVGRHAATSEDKENDESAAAEDENIARGMEISSKNETSKNCRDAVRRSSPEGDAAAQDHKRPPAGHPTDHSYRRTRTGMGNTRTELFSSVSTRPASSASE